jgi:hypothetical protein
MQIRGNPANAGPVVPRRFLAVLSPVAPTPFKQGSGRLELARAITTDAAPLAARVFVNRVWKYHFGTGLVETPSDFGAQGERPSHPELLDDLAARFVKSGWSLRWLHREIVLSAAYRQSSHRDPDKQAVDPDNRLLWRAHRKRVTAESLRDAMLAVSGELNRSPGGSPVAGLGYLAINNSNQASSGRDTSTLRRSVYLPIIRNELPAFLTTFDFADPDVVTGRRSETNVPAQALFLLNDPFVKQRAAATAEKLLADESASDSDRIVDAYRLILTRTPTAEEMQRAETFITTGLDRGESWRQFVQALFASTEFRMLD